MTGRLEGKVVVITGTGGGQGRVAAVRFAEEGAAIAGCDLDAERADETVALVRQNGGTMISVAPVNLSAEPDVRSVIDAAIAEYGGFDVLYNNASGARFDPIEDMSLEHWNYTLQNELTLVYLAIKHSVDVFRKRAGGSIINVASIAGMTGGGRPGNMPGGCAHVVTKAGIIALTRTLACELAPLRIRVNCISPGGINTPGLAPLYADPQSPARRRMLAAQLVDRLGESDDVVAGAVYLASDEAAFVTGVNLPIDGGYTAAGGAGRPGSAFSEITGESPKIQFN